jgi:hypothetical protein
MKYTEEARLSFGCAKVRLPGGAIEGRRCKPFIYSGKWLRTIKEFEELRAQEIRRVRTLPGSGAPWVVGHRKAEDGYFEEDEVSAMHRIGKVLAEKLSSEGVKTVGQLANLSDECLTEFARKTARVTQTRLINLRNLARNAKPGAYLSKVIDHKIAANPYQSLYGDEWEEKLDSSTAMKGHMCVKSLVEHIISASAKVMQGTEFENDWYFFHDALTQMTNKETIEWMDQKGYLKHWILPMEGLNDGTPFAGRPVGNSPEIMAWDCSLNKDVDDAFIRHKALTQSLARDDPKKFCSSTPHRLTSSYSRLVDPAHGSSEGSPTGSRIVQDIDRCMGNHLLKIIEAKGTVVQNLGSRNGHRRQSGLNTRGGKREKGQCQAQKWIHDDAKTARAEILQRSINRF